MPEQTFKKKKDHHGINRILHFDMYKEFFFLEWKIHPKLPEVRWALKETCKEIHLSQKSFCLIKPKIVL